MFLIECIVKETPVTKDETVCVTMTRNQAVLASLIMALRRLKKACRLDIYLDSQYVAAGLNGRMDCWIANGWENSKNKPIENAVEWQILAQLLKGHEYRVHLREDHSYKNWMKSKLENVDFTLCESTF